MPPIYQPEEDSYLLSQTIKKFVKNKNIKVLEIGSGSGIQLQTLLEIGIKKENIFGCDINSKAVTHCKKLGFDCVKSKLFSHIKGKFDLIIFNPPYLPEDKYDKFQDTTGGKEGSEVINEFLAQAKSHLTEKGKILLLVSSLTKGINFRDYKKSIIAKKKLFYEELFVLSLFG